MLTPGTSTDILKMNVHNVLTDWLTHHTHDN